MKKIVQLEDKIMNWIRNYTKYILMNLVFGIIVYFMMISENLVNSYDGIWNTSYKVSEAWETSLGRGLLHYFDKLRAGVVSMPLNSILTL